MRPEQWRTSLLVAVIAVSFPLAVFVLAAEGSGEDRYRDLDELPTTAGSVEEIEPTAIALADALEAVAVSEARLRTACPTDRLRVSWKRPVGYEHGAYIEPLGPAPDEDTGAVNGVVVCEGSTYAFMGFEAIRTDDGEWLLAGVPVHEHDDHNDLAGPPVPPLDEAPRSDEEPPELPGTSLDLGPIDDYAPYEPQRICDPDPEPGTVALAQALLEIYPGTRNYGISRAVTSADGRSTRRVGRSTGVSTSKTPRSVRRSSTSSSGSSRPTPTATRTRSRVGWGSCT